MRNHGPFKQDEHIQVEPEFHPTGTQFSYADGTKVSPKSACQTCGYSLYWCKDETPIVLGRDVKISKP